MGALKLSYYENNISVNGSDYQLLKVVAKNGVIITQSSNYYTYGGPLYGRQMNNFYRFGWNNQEKIDEIAGKGNHNTAEHWEYDTRTGIRWNPDPDGISFWSPYAVNYGMPLKLSDPKGDCPWVLVVGLVMLADVLVAPTNDHEGDAIAIAAARRDHDIGLVTTFVAPGVGKLAGKYIYKPVINKTLPILKKVVQKQIIKKTEEKIIKQTEKKILEKSGQQGEKKLIQKNAEQGAKFEKEVLEETTETQTDVVQQITVKTKSGVKTRIDIVGKDKSTGQIKLTEAKSSSTAPLTKNQKSAFPELEQSGGTVVGEGKSPFVGGTEIPPTTVEIVRPK